MQLKIGDKVKNRLTHPECPDYWREGVIIEFDKDKPGRIRVEWKDGLRRTWISDSKLILDN